MGRPPLPVGTYGRIQVYPLSWEDSGLGCGIATTTE
jgi:hypothetical protein